MSILYMYLYFKLYKYLLCIVFHQYIELIYLYILPVFVLLTVALHLLVHMS